MSFKRTGVNIRKYIGTTEQKNWGYVVVTLIASSTCSFSECTNAQDKLFVFALGVESKGNMDRTEKNEHQNK